MTFVLLGESWNFPRRTIWNLRIFMMHTCKTAGSSRLFHFPFLVLWSALVILLIYSKCTGFINTKFVILVDQSKFHNTRTYWKQLLFSKYLTLSPSEEIVLVLEKICDLSVVSYKDIRITEFCLKYMKTCGYWNTINLEQWFRQCRDYVRLSTYPFI